MIKPKNTALDAAKRIMDVIAIDPSILAKTW